MSLPQNPQNNQPLPPAITSKQLNDWRGWSEDELESAKMATHDDDIYQILNQLVYVARYQREIDKCNAKIASIIALRPAADPTTDPHWQRYVTTVRASDGETWVVGSTNDVEQAKRVTAEMARVNPGLHYSVRDQELDQELDCDVPYTVTPDALRPIIYHDIADYDPAADRNEYPASLVTFDPMNAWLWSIARRYDTPLDAVPADILSALTYRGLVTAFVAATIGGDWRVVVTQAGRAAVRAAA